MTIRVFLVDDHQVVRVGMRAFLGAIADIEVVGDAADGQRALDRIERLDPELRPHVVLMDLVLGTGPDGIATTAAVRARFPEIGVIVVTSFGDVARVHAALAAGAAGYVLKDADVNEIVFAIRAARRGGVHLDASVTRLLTQSLVAPPTRPAALTGRERDVLVAVAHGRSNREISRRLGIGERTVQSHLSSVLTKLGLTSRTQAALWAVREGLADPRSGDGQHMPR
ncbi:MAG TPA: response regulator transcription factor [Pseudonocardia sp.]|nr:response regulator transcription factor [Pseudonocardia sp.]